MSLEGELVKSFAERIAADLVGTVVDRLQEMTVRSQKGDVVGFQSVWEEFCIQAQLNVTDRIDTHLRLIRNLTDKCLAILDDHERVALWLLSESGRAWKQGALDDEEPPVNDDDVERYLRSRVLWAALVFKSEAVDRYIQRHNSVGVNEPSSPLHKYIDLNRAKEEGQIYYNPPKSCECCGNSLSEAEFFVDGALRDASAGWAIMCDSCFSARGKGIRWGAGQLYMQQKNREWLCVGGFR